MPNEAVMMMQMPIGQGTKGSFSQDLGSVMDVVQGTLTQEQTRRRRVWQGEQGCYFGGGGWRRRLAVLTTGTWNPAIIALEQSGKTKRGQMTFRAREETGGKMAERTRPRLGKKVRNKLFLERRAGPFVSACCLLLI